MPAQLAHCLKSETKQNGKVSGRVSQIIWPNQISRQFASVRCFRIICHKNCHAWKEKWKNAMLKLETRMPN